MTLADRRPLTNAYERHSPQSEGGAFVRLDWDLSPIQPNRL